MDSLRVAVLQMVSGDDLDHNLAQAEALAQVVCFSGPDRKEGVDAFFEKRKPEFNKPDAD